MDLIQQGKGFPHVHGDPLLGLSLFRTGNRVVQRFAGGTKHIAQAVSTP